MKYKFFFSHLWQKVVRTARILKFRIDYDQSFLRAASLTYQTLLSIVPLLAVTFGIAKGFGLEAILQNVLKEEFRDQQEVIDYFIQFSERLLEQTRGGLIAGIGIIVLLITVMRLFSNIENALNSMWGINGGRPLSRKLSDYLALILICPLLVVASSSITVFVTTKLNQITTSGQLPELVGPYLLYLIPLIPYVMSTLLFTLVYIIMPYTNVRFTSSLIAGLCAGIAYQILQATYISIQIQVSSAGAIYGSFAALPLFLMWLYLSWLIFLIGGQIVVIHQERLWDIHIFSPLHELTMYERTLIYLACVKASVDAYLNKSPICIMGLAKALRMPERLITRLVEDLVQAKIVIKTQTPNLERVAIVPAQSPENLKLFDVLHQIQGSNELPSPYIEALDRLLSTLKEEQTKSHHNILIKDISTSALSLVG